MDVVCCYHLMMYRDGSDPLLPRAGSTLSPFTNLIQLCLRITQEASVNLLWTCQIAMAANLKCSLQTFVVFVPTSTVSRLELKLITQICWPSVRVSWMLVYRQAINCQWKSPGILTLYCTHSDFLTFAGCILWKHNQYFVIGGSANA